MTTGIDTCSSTFPKCSLLEATHSKVSKRNHSRCSQVLSQNVNRTEQIQTLQHMRISPTNITLSLETSKALQDQSIGKRSFDFHWHQFSFHCFGFQLVASFDQIRCLLLRNKREKKKNNLMAETTLPAEFFFFKVLPVSKIVTSPAIN